LIFIALLVPHLFGVVIGRSVDRYGPRWIAATGMVLLLPFWVLMRLVDRDSTRQVVLLVVLLVGLGAATALCVVSLMTEFSSVVSAKMKQRPHLFGNQSGYATSYGLFNVAWATGSVSLCDLPGPRVGHDD
jgi:predicted MFS family arabinose efflux permease